MLTPRPVRIMLAPDAYCAAPAAKRRLAELLFEDSHEDSACFEVTDPALADVCLLHVSALRMPGLLQVLPALRRVPKAAILVGQGGEPRDDIDSHADAGSAALWRHSNAIWSASRAVVCRLQRVHHDVLWLPQLDTYDDSIADTGAGLPNSAAHLLPQLPQASCVLMAIERPSRPSGLPLLAQLERAFAYVHARFVDTHLVLVTPVSDPATASCNVHGVTHLRADLAEVDIHRLIRASDVYVHLDADAHLDADVLYAMQCGTLCIAPETLQRLDLLTSNNHLSVPLRHHEIHAPVCRTDLEARLLRGVTHVKAGTHLRLTRQAERDATRLQTASRRAAVFQRIVQLQQRAEVLSLV